MGKRVEKTKHSRLAYTSKNFPWNSSPYIIRHTHFFTFIYSPLCIRGEEARRGCWTHDSLKTLEAVNSWQGCPQHLIHVFQGSVISREKQSKLLSQPSKMCNCGTTFRHHTINHTPTVYPWYTMLQIYYYEVYILIGMWEVVIILILYYYYYYCYYIRWITSWWWKFLRPLRAA